MKHKHRYYGYGQMDVPTGKWIVNHKEVRADIFGPHETIPYEDQTPVELTRKAIVVICRGCGDIKVKLPKLPTQSNP